MTNVDSFSIPTSYSSLDSISFDEQLARLKSDFKELWQVASESAPSFGKEYDATDKRRHESDLEELIALMKDGDVRSEEDLTRQLQHLKSSVRSMVVRSVDADRRSETDAILNEFSDAGDEYVRQAKEFDPTLKMEDLFQALRNLWILNSMQIGLGLAVGVNRSGLAYSLLYPYTDNYLDDPKIKAEEKWMFSRKFRDRLSGIAAPVSSVLESRTWDLVEMIESEYPRVLYPDVYRSLLAIHAGQDKSISQHESSEYVVRADLLRISIEKGGSSVLTDAYLAKGFLTADEAKFSFGYGVFLQLIDDLQDVREDIDHGHHTLFTETASRGALDGIAVRLHRFVDEVLDSCIPEANPRLETLTALVRQSCRVLILESIARYPELYSTQFIAYAERYSPVSFDRIRSLHATMKAKQVGINQVLKSRRMLNVAAATA